MATISHEIRTPLNSILGFAALVADDPTLSVESCRRLDLVSRAGRSLAEIVGDLLDFAKVEAGRLDLTLTPVSPAALLRDAVDIIAPEAAAKGLYLRAMFEGDVDAPVALDETRLRQVLLNLLANAVKFTREGGVVARLTAGPAPAPFASRSPTPASVSPPRFRPGSSSASPRPIVRSAAAMAARAWAWRSARPWSAPWTARSASRAS